MIDIWNIEPGKSYTCTFTLKNIPLDSFGRPGGMMSMADLPVRKYGDYISTGDLVARDRDTELVEVQDHKSDGTPKTYVVPFVELENICEAE